MKKYGVYIELTGSYCKTIVAENEAEAKREALEMVKAHPEEIYLEIASVEARGE